MVEKITYLIGAGASANALPTVNRFEERILEFVNEFDKWLKDKKMHSETWGTFLLRLKSFAHSSKAFGSIDTLAKYYYLMNRVYLNELKSTISVYFVIEQMVLRNLDTRYLGFITTILNDLTWPERVKVLTWNYDFQMELAAMEFKQDKVHRSNTGNSLLPSDRLIKYYPYPHFYNEEKKEVLEFDLLHLNGIAGFFKDDKEKFMYSSFHNMNSNEQALLVENIEKYLNGKTETVFTFAWEDDKKSIELTREYTAMHMVHNTEVLVIIGYSFPYFNRLYDNSILAAMNDNNNLRKIYYQDPYLDGQFLRRRFDLNKDIEIIHVKETDRFFVPNEF